jgi:hypothetical protein
MSSIGEILPLNGCGRERLVPSRTRTVEDGEWAPGYGPYAKKIMRPRIPSEWGKWLWRDARKPETIILIAFLAWLTWATWPHLVSAWRATHP